jgi:hypothetical protein
MMMALMITAKKIVVRRGVCVETHTRFGCEDVKKLRSKK